jgi:hypothetical protein
MVRRVVDDCHGGEHGGPVGADVGWLVGGEWEVPVVYGHGRLVGGPGPCCVLGDSSGIGFCT